jgi:hypothetical protein
LLALLGGATIVVVSRLRVNINNRVTKFLKKNVEAMTEKHAVDLLQQTATLGISHTIREVLQSET